MAQSKQFKVALVISLKKLKAYLDITKLYETCWGNSDQVCISGGQVETWKSQQILL